MHRRSVVASAPKCDIAQSVDAAQLKTNFLANIGHEMRTPLNAIIGIGEILAGTPLDERQTSYVETMRDAGSGLLQLLNDVIDLAKLEGGVLAIEPRAFNLHEMLNDLGARFGAAATSRNLTLSIRIDSDVPARVVADEARFRQVVSNLVSNAVKFTDDGLVVVRASVIGDEGRFGGVVVHVRDTGVGIPAEQLDRIFEPFTQVDESSTRGGSGSGLGLAVARQVVSLLQGSVAVTSSVGEGSCFTVRVPMTLEPAPVALVAPPAPTAAGPAPRVLVADDNPVNQLVVQTMLRQHGCHVDVADDGAAALRHATHARYDLVFMDVQMPVMDGYQATTEIRALPAPHGDVPIVALTASALPEDRVRCIGAGMDDYVAKPIAKETLVKLLGRFVARTEVPA